MDAGIADTLNRRVVQLIVKQLDTIDLSMPVPEIRWPGSAMADTLMGTGPDTNGDRAWLVGFLAARTPDIDYDGNPADCDWDNLFSHFRAEILARRAPETPNAETAEIRSCAVV
jgi:hypothetical protein